MVDNSLYDVSSSSLCHCTRTIDALKGIIKNGFRANFCTPEDINYINWEKALGIKCDKLNLSPMSFPMVCFTDLPHDKRNQHHKLYGSYSIEMTEDWKVRSNVQPVIYLKAPSISFNGEDARLSNNILPNVIRLAMFGCDKYTKRHPDSYPENFINLLIAYFKIYQKESIRFYDEREWRFVPLPHDGENMILTPEMFGDQDRMSNVKNILWSHPDSYLQFNFEDIERIEVTNRSERKDIASCLTNRFEIPFNDAIKKCHLT